MPGWKPKIDSNLDMIKRPRAKAKVIELRLRALLPDRLDHAQELVLMGLLPLVCRLHSMWQAWNQSGTLHPDYSKTLNQVLAALNRLGLPRQRPQAAQDGRSKADPGIDLAAILES